MSFDVTGLRKELAEREAFRRQAKFNKSRRIFKFIESIDSSKTLVDAASGIVAIDKINENPQELDAIFSNYEVDPNVANILNLIKTDFNVGLVCALNGDASDITDITITVAERDTVSKLMQHFAEYSAGCPVEVSWDTEGDDDILTVKFTQDVSGGGAGITSEAIQSAIDPMNFTFDSFADEEDEEVTVIEIDNVSTEDDDDEEEDEEDDKDDDNSDSDDDDEDSDSDDEDED